MRGCHSGGTHFPQDDIYATLGNLPSSLGTCETAPEVNNASAEKKWLDIKAKLDVCLKGDWMSRNAGERNIFFADQKKGEALSLSLREVAGFKRVGNELKTFPTYYNRLSIFPRKKMTK